MKPRTTYQSNTITMPHLHSINRDYADRMRYAGLGGGGEVWYVHDTKLVRMDNASGERVRKVIENHNIKEERFYLGGYEVYTKTNNGTVETERETLHVNDGTKRMALFDTEKATSGGTGGTSTIPGSGPVADLGKTTIRYQYGNHLGSASLELDEKAEIISYEEYHPFGTTSFRSGRTETETSLKRYKYIGKERDNETGLYYYGARYYAAWLGRFVSVDPLAGEFPSYSPYVYGNDNPLRYSDPTGMQSEDEVDQVHTNFSIKKGDAQAKTDIQTLPESKNQKFVKFTEEGGVYLDFGKKEGKREKLLAKDEGLQLIDDLQHAQYTNDVGIQEDAKILYQTEGPFEFSGFKEKEFSALKTPTKWTGKSGDISKIHVRGQTVKPSFIWNASISEYGKDSYSDKTPTILPKNGFQGQIAIAKGAAMIDIDFGIKLKDTIVNGEFGQKQYRDIQSVNIRKDIVKHELRENLFRTTGNNGKGMKYLEAHAATIAMYGERGGNIVDNNFRFVWK